MDPDQFAEMNRQQALLVKAKAGLVNMATLALFVGTVVGTIVVFR